MRRIIWRTKVQRILSGASPLSPNDHQNRRAIARLSTEYIACLLSEGVAETGLDILDFVICMVVSANNVGHLKGKTAELKKIGGPDPFVPPELMTPVTRGAIAESLKLPYETARRRIKYLIDRGVLVAVGGSGVIIGAPVTSSNTTGRLANKNLAMTQRFVRQLAEAGLET